MVADTIERVLVLRHPIEKVWAALTTAEGLSRWFGSIADIDLRPGGRAFFRWDDLDDETVATIETVDPPHRFSFRWRLEGLPEKTSPRTLVEFRLEPVPEGTRLHLTESGFTQAADHIARPAHDANSHGWTAELADLETYLDAA
ncbi:SRPBCC domain-containing protein [Phytomonospora endophytica]|uniref:Uncharacterized protein YndB with AHSA1/START domain n=1 Tax=Phytomonospora endophytica TaxID=714109 RepID=A0A841FZF9_9ACTN|nr:SRPBCC domain-containing protein [Phytomonospora endophytica]MBB6037829.1 uncharacterized protein YndB with AHSA1/START domain [Phytomonospora endophytica]GIG68728.1 vanillate O-demethylase oxidoreductase VanB [Phytomonospora endophytica]